jgi:protease IV
MRCYDFCMTFIQELGKSVAWGFVALITFAIGLYMFGAWHDDWSGFSASVEVSDGVCNIAVIPLHAEISSYTYFDELGYEVLTSSLDDFEAALRAAEEDPAIQGVIVSIDSPGGSGYAGEAMANALKRSALPSAVVVRDMAFSAAYWAATGADTIIASAISDVGSIGVTMSYLETVRQDEDNGLDYIEISSGPYKDAGNPSRFLTDEELAMFQADIDKDHQEFVRQVAINRGMTTDAVAALADGSTRVGTDALALGLIDQIGDKETARTWLAEELGIDPGDAIICE